MNYPQDEFQAKCEGKKGGEKEKGLVLQFWIWQAMKQEVSLIYITIFSTLGPVNSRSMYEKIKSPQGKINGNSVHSNGSKEHPKEQTPIKDTNHINPHFGLPIRSDHNIAYQFQSSPQSPSNRDQSNSIIYNHKQHIQMMELDFQAVIRGYELRLKSLNEEYRRNKQEMENKLKQLFREKNHWQNIASRYSEPINAEKNKQREEIERQKEWISKLENEKEQICIEKQEISKQLQNILNENQILKQKIAQLSRLDSKGKYTAQPRVNRIHQHSPVKVPENPKPSHIMLPPQPSIKQFQLTKLTCDKMKHLVRDLNEQLMKQKMTSLNAKFGKQLDVASRGGRQVGTPYAFVGSNQKNKKY